MSDKEVEAAEFSSDPTVSFRKTEPYFSSDLISKRYQRILLYAVYAMIGIKLVGQYVSRPCCRGGTLGFFMAPVDNTINLIGGIYQWQWRHLSEATRPSDIQMFVMYCLVFVVSAMLMALVFKRDDEDDYLDNVVISLFGFLVAHIAVNLSLSGGSYRFGMISEWFYTVANHYFIYLFAACYFMLRLNRIPIIELAVNRFVMFSGFFAGLLFVVISGSFSATYFMRIMHFNNTEQQIRMLMDIKTMLINNIGLALISIVVAWLIIKMIRLKSWLARFEENKPVQDVAVSRDDEAIRGRLAQR